MQDRLRPHRVNVGAMFPELATAVLEEIPMPAMNVLAMTDWAASQHPLPKQVNFHGSFGEPPLVVYETPEFYLEVLFWFPSRTTIHGHGFTGAFRVLDGYSIQVEYEFSQEAAPEEGVRLGRTLPRSVELITPGQVCTIGGNEAFIHTVAHMGNPSLTLVARTHGSQEFEQFSYHRCGLATRASWHHRSIARQADVFRALLRGRPESFRPRLMEFLERSGVFVFFHLLDQLRARMSLDVFTREVLSPVRERFHPGHAKELAALDEEVRREALWAMLNATPDTRRRLLMALNEILPDQPEREAVISCSNGGIAAGEVIEQWSRCTRS
ncbi:MAG: hypothetical protein EBS05_26455 [Proteobacteria bacterium]|nr:hypothetical protein [Pseudomonadota bacterium]